MKFSVSAFFTLFGKNVSKIQKLVSKKSPHRKVNSIREFEIQLERVTSCKGTDLHDVTHVFIVI